MSYLGIKIRMGGCEMGLLAVAALWVILNAGFVCVMLWVDGKYPDRRHFFDAAS